jgi:hypothetical protein
MAAVSGRTSFTGARRNTVTLTLREASISTSLIACHRHDRRPSATPGERDWTYSAGVHRTSLPLISGTIQRSPDQHRRTQSAATPEQYPDCYFHGHNRPLGADVQGPTAPSCTPGSTTTSGAGLHRPRPQRLATTAAIPYSTRRKQATGPRSSTGRIRSDEFFCVMLRSTFSMTRGALAFFSSATC